MEKFDIFADIALRTGGSVYVGVVGPVRTGKSTFIKRFMDLLVMPNIEDVHLKERTRDELPQSGAGKMIMTTEPKFVPDEPVEITFKESTRLRVRLVDCVGYTVPSAKGYMEEEGVRMVMTPWFDHPIPFQEAAELGTRKVISEHSTIGLVITTDGSISDIPRADYQEAEERVIRELQELEKPFVIVLNSIHPLSRETIAQAEALQEKYGVLVIPLDCLRMEQGDIVELLHQVLYAFPLREVSFLLPRWMDELKPNHWMKERYEEAIFLTMQEMNLLRDVHEAVLRLDACDGMEAARVENLDMGTGRAVIALRVESSLFYQVLADLTQLEIEGEHHLLRLMQDLSLAKKEYDKISSALTKVREIGYGIVMPDLEDISFDHPELMKQGRNFGLKLTASAPSIHMIRADIMTEVTPLVATEKQGEELIQSLTQEFEEDPAVLWSRDFLGKSLQDMVREGIASKLNRMPENAQEKLQETLEKIINEGSGGLICIIL